MHVELHGEDYTVAKLDWHAALSVEHCW